MHQFTSWQQHKKQHSVNNFQNMHQQAQENCMGKQNGFESGLDTSQIINNLGNVINTLVNSRLAQQRNSSIISSNNANSKESLPNDQLGKSDADSEGPPNNYHLDESKCHVCGDKSTGSHFGGISCESCKAFFRRSVQKNRHEDYKCSYSGRCKMNTTTRKICQYCRYKHCLITGMKSKWVLSDDERHQKYGNRRKLQKKESASANQPSPKEPKLFLTQESVKRPDFKSLTEQSTPSSVSDDESVKAENKSYDLDDNAKVSSNCVVLTTYSLSVAEKSLIDHLSMYFYHSRKYNTLDLNLQEKIANIFQTQSHETLKNMSKVILANFIVQPVKRVITFAKLITDFRQLDINDQLALLQGGTMELFICSSSSLYDSVSNKIDNIVSKDRKIAGVDRSNIQLDILRLMWNEEVFTKTISFLKSMHDLDIDEATLILLLPLILFTPDRRHLVNKKRVCQLQANYSLILKKYIIWKYGNKHALTLFPNLLLKLIELRTLHDMHSSILLDADQTQLDPYPLALLFNKVDDTKSGLKTESLIEPKQNVCSSRKPDDDTIFRNTSILTPDSLGYVNPNSTNPVSSVDSLTENSDGDPLNVSSHSYA